MTGEERMSGLAANEAEASGLAANEAEASVPEAEAIADVRDDPGLRHDEEGPAGIEDEEYDEDDVDEEDGVSEDDDVSRDDVRDDPADEEDADDHEGDLDDADLEDDDADLEDDDADLEDDDGELDDEDDEEEPDDGEAAADEDEEPEFATVATGADIESAKRTALAQLRKIVPWVTEGDVEYEVVEEGARGGFFGRGRKGAEVEARVRSSAVPADDGLEPLAEDLREFLDGLIDRMGLDAHIDVRDEDDAVIADMSGPDLGILIGRHGQTIDALQYLCAIAVNRRCRSRRRVIVDAEGYRDRRAASLHSMADRVAQRVVREREPIMLKPMSAAERKVIHLRLKDNPKVETSSEGQEPNRAVVIAPRSR
jgi:spoIIIJ-associated protein